MTKIELMQSPVNSIGVGSVVTLKSGGPAMTVIERSAEKANCCWHIDDGSMHDAWVALVILKVKT